MSELGQLTVLTPLRYLPDSVATCFNSKVTEHINKLRKDSKVIECQKAEMNTFQLLHFLLLQFLATIEQLSSGGLSGYPRLKPNLKFAVQKSKIGHRFLLQK